MSKKLVLYYSFEGHTKKIAEFISQNLNIDICEIKPEKELKSKGFSKYLWGGSQVFMEKKPILLPLSVDLNAYDEIYLGSPIWAWTFAPPIKTLLEKEEFKNKKIHFFYTHGGGPGKALEKAKEEFEKNNTLVSALDILDKDIRENFEAVQYKISHWIN